MGANIVEVGFMETFALFIQATALAPQIMEKETAVNKLMGDNTIFMPLNLLEQLLHYSASQGTTYPTQ
jgi:hypothetical protein